MKQVVIEKVPCDWITHCPKCNSTMIEVPTTHKRPFRILVKSNEVHKVDASEYKLVLSEKCYTAIYDETPGVYELLKLRSSEIKKLIDVASEIYWKNGYKALWKAIMNSDNF